MIFLQLLHLVDIEYFDFCHSFQQFSSYFHWPTTALPIERVSQTTMVSLELLLLPLLFIVCGSMSRSKSHFLYALLMVAYPYLKKNLSKVDIFFCNFLLICLNLIVISGQNSNPFLHLRRDTSRQST